MALEPAAPLETTLAALRAIEGIGEWAVQYIAMRSLGWPNAFPEDDTMFMKRSGSAGPFELDQLAARREHWQPWRAYAAVRIWDLIDESNP
ncbi:hypothetical protein [Paraburkholderia sp. J63]|uniref:hypothetical protein n=1 Tax=Paraburkholderia sp. J63 TaxID=2805434 RepID=UPI002ABE048D|nr:hypothetical protein [Paraburkholderia sp. J63]